MMRILLIFCFLGNAIYLHAQLCTGIPGPLVYSETFGAGAVDLGPALPAGSTTYNYGSIGPGNYVVVNNCGVNGSFWHNSLDHTPNDVNGFMLVFDASVEPGIFFKKRLSGLCGGSKYTFSAWVMNVQIPGDCLGQEVRPDILFEMRDINTGALLGQTSTGPVLLSVSPIWTQFALTFYVPLGQTDVEVVLRNNAKGACGNDLAIDDFELYLCSPFSTQDFTLCAGESIQVGNKVYTQAGQYKDLFPIGQGCNDSTVITNIYWLNQPLVQKFNLCQGDTLKVLNSVYTQGGVFQDRIERPGCDSLIITYLNIHAPDTTRQSYYLCAGDSVIVGGNVYTQPGAFSDLLMNRFGCDSLVQTTLILDVPLTIAVEPAFTELELGSSVQFQTTLSRTNHVKVIWSPAAGLSCSDCLDPLGQPVENTIYVVRASDTLGTCTAVDMVEVRVSACKTMFIPNVFAPDDDGTNDFFTVFGGNCVQKVHILQIFDRWGTKVFDRTDFSPNEESLGWDGRVGGRLAPPGVYVYWADLELLGGRLVRFSGTVTLVR
jgi:gliding motility-associated-like protein